MPSTHDEGTGRLSYPQLDREHQLSRKAKKLRKNFRRMRRLKRSLWGELKYPPDRTA